VGAVGVEIAAVVMLVCCCCRGCDAGSVNRGVLGKDDAFVVTGRWVRFVVDAATGASRAAITHRTCITVDPLGRHGVDGQNGLIGYDLTNGRQRWAIDRETTVRLRLELVSAYGGRWTFAPLERLRSRTPSQGRIPRPVTRSRDREEEPARARRHG
jgi:hypothetical protein